MLSYLHGCEVDELADLVERDVPGVRVDGHELVVVPEKGNHQAKTRNGGKLC